MTKVINFKHTFDPLGPELDYSLDKIMNVAVATKVKYPRGEDIGRDFFKDRPEGAPLGTTQLIELTKVLEANQLSFNERGACVAKYIDAMVLIISTMSAVVLPRFITFNVDVSFEIGDDGDILLRLNKDMNIEYGMNRQFKMFFVNTTITVMSVIPREQKDDKWELCDLGSIDMIKRTANMFFRSVKEIAVARGINEELSDILANTLARSVAIQMELVKYPDKCFAVKVVQPFFLATTKDSVFSFSIGDTGIFGMDYSITADNPECITLTEVV